jgi:SAM-dependent methyltransferase
MYCMISKGKPRRLKGLIEGYNLSEKKVLDLGAGEGLYLNYFSSESVGLEIGKENIYKARKLGLNMVFCDLESEEWPIEKNSFDVVWCSNYFEHTLSPHKFLIKTRNYLNDEGIVVISVPVMHLFSDYFSKILSPFRGYLAADHVNFFNRKSVKLTIERAGFDLIEVYSNVILNNSKFSIIVNKIASIFWFNLVVVAKKKKNWNYPNKSHKNLVDNVIVFKV